MGERSRRFGIVLCALGPTFSLFSAVQAQELPGIGGPDTLQAVASDRWHQWGTLGDLRVRGDFVDGLPGGREVQRGRSFLRFGAAVTPLAALELGAAGEAALGSDHNSENRINNDNETSDDFNLDLLYGRWRPRPELEISAGRNALPFLLTPLTWDDDLRPDGGTIAARLPSGDFDAWRLAAGWLGVRNLAESWARLAAVQAGFSWRDGGPRGADARLAYLYWDHVGALVADGLARTNATRNARFVSDFRILDLQLRWRAQLGPVPSVLHGEWVENLGADAASTGVRAGLVLGDVGAHGHVQVQYFYHRTEQDAVLAAFNADDWWFHSRLRGHRGSVSLALGRRTILGISGSLERRDDLETWTKRLLLDLRVDLSS